MLRHAVEASPSCLDDLMRRQVIALSKVEGAL